MKQFINKFSVLILFLAFCCFSLPSVAQNLTAEDVKNFSNVMTAVKNSNDPAIESLRNKTNFKGNEVLAIAEDGSIYVFQNALKQETSSDSKNAMQSVVQNNGFSSLEQWAKTSDQILAAYLNVELENKGGLEKIPELTPQIRQALPPQMINQIEGVIIVAQAAQKASAEDVAVVKANYVQLEKSLK